MLLTKDVQNSSKAFILEYFLCLCGSSAVECRTPNRESPGSNPPFDSVSKFGHFRSIQDSPLYSINEYLAIDSSGNVID